MRIVVISPHLDDAVLSLGAAIEHAGRRGASVDVLTVFAGDVSSQRRAGRWDRACGFRLAGEAAAARRREDEHACRTLGARPVWLSFGDEQYPRGGRPGEIARAIAGHVQAADLVLVPGHPLRHRDHSWLARHLAAADLGAGAVAAYVEQPYAYLAAATPKQADWHALAVSEPSTTAKHDACRAYHSQLPVLPEGMLGKIADHERQQGGEMIRHVAGSAEHFASVTGHAWPRMGTG